MALAARQHANARCAIETVTLNIPITFCKECVTRSCKTGDMGHLGTRNQCKTGTRWQPKQLLEPGTAHFFYHVYGWATGKPCRI